MLNTSLPLPTVPRERKVRPWDVVDENMSQQEQKVMALRSIPQIHTSDAFSNPLNSSLTSNVNALQGQSQSGLPVGDFRRIYIGSINYNIPEALITEIFKAFGSIARVEMPRDNQNNLSKGYCFLEYSTNDMAFAALSTMNAFTLQGRPLKVGVPSDCPPYPVDLVAYAARQDVQTMYNAAVTIRERLGLYAPTIATAVSAAPDTARPENRIYVGSINYDLSTDDIRKLFDSFGPIVHINMVPNTETGKHKGYGFIDFAHRAAADEAIQRMNGVQVGDRSISVSNVRTATEPANTNVIVLRNMLSASQYAEEDVAEFEAEIREECGKYGRVSKVVVKVSCKQDDAASSDQEKDEVLIYIAYFNREHAAAAMSALQGRVFDGRAVNVLFAQPTDL